MPSLIALQRRFVASLLPCPSARRWRRRRHQTCVCTDAPDGARPRGERKDALVHSTPVSSTSSFCRRRRRRRLLGRQAAGRGTTFGAGCAARRAASAPSPPHLDTCTARARTQRHRLVAARARAGPTWESERSSTVARARQGARRKGRARRSKASGPSSDAPGAGRSGAEARGARRGLEKRYCRRGCTNFWTHELKGVRASIP